MSDNQGVELLANAPLQAGQPPKDRVFYARHHVALKWTSYKPTSQEVKRGKMGRWQELRPYGIGWQNTEVVPEAGAWVEDVLNNPKLRTTPASAGALVETMKQIGRSSDVTWPDGDSEQLAHVLRIARQALSATATPASDGETAKALEDEYYALSARADQDTGNEGEDMAALGLRDGYEQAVQTIDVLTGGDGEYRFCSVPDDSHCPDPPAMIRRIVARLTPDRFGEGYRAGEWQDIASAPRTDDEDQPCVLVLARGRRFVAEWDPASGYFFGTVAIDGYEPGHEHPGRLYGATHWQPFPKAIRALQPDAGEGA